MNKILGLLLGLVLFTGCVSTETKETISKQAARADNMVSKIEANQTTRDQEQAYIKAQRIVWHAMDYDVNDTDLPPDVKILLEKLDLLCED